MATVILVRNCARGPGPYAATLARGTRRDGIASPTGGGLRPSPGRQVAPTRPMADMANKVSINSFVYDQLSFLRYDWTVLVWTPSGSCPLCLTPPCYQLQKPPISSAALFVGAPGMAQSAVTRAV